jgi:hypothetical protein
VFWAQLLHVAVVGIAVAIFVPESALRTRSKLDVLGAVILGLGAFVLLFGIGKATAWGTPLRRRFSAWAAVSPFSPVGWCMSARRRNRSSICRC